MVPCVSWVQPCVDGLSWPSRMHVGPLRFDDRRHDGQDLLVKFEVKRIFGQKDMHPPLDRVLGGPGGVLGRKLKIVYLSLPWIL